GGPSFSGPKNVNNAAARAAAGSVLSMKELLDVAGVLRAVRSLTQWRSTNAGVESVLDPLFGALSPNKFLENEITSAILSEEEISDSASPELYEIRRKIRVQESKVRDQLDKMTHSAHYSKFMQENIITQRNGRYVVPVKAEYRGEVQGLVHDTSSSGATVFIEPMPVVEANNEIKVLRSKEKDEIERILTVLSSGVGEYEQQIKDSYECAVELNLIFAKAQYAYSIGATVPQLNANGEIELRAARHPLIDKDKVVPVDIRLGTDFDTLVITGPNTGGKTVSIKTIGLLTLMAMSGLMIPAGDRSRLSVFDEVLADIGDEQSIEQSLSTFSAHMTNIIDIMKTSGEHSLVLIDELGAGTDPVEGAALAMAVLEDL
ncbi:MAG: endonuclease MutS2, partial [Oscillospiraceae bacterium]|nr:endonuclease MutS2 [Oscillospiraceae bacterium]